MKRLILATVAAAALAGPMMLGATDAAAQDRHHDRGGYGGERHDRDGDRDRDGRWDGRGGDHRWDRRWDRGGDRWDSGRHNGYYYNNRWSYGPPPHDYYGRPGYRPGYSSWRRGSYLPPYYRDRGYVVYDYGRYHLRPPPRGYYWYRVGDDYLLAAIASGLIFDVIINSGGY
jgi:Ni/Co efflux regulator RcnB